MKQTGEYLAKIRIKAGLSQWEVATKFSLASGQLISNWERGQCFPPMHMLPILAKAYGVPVKRIFNKIQKEKRERDWRVVKGE